MKKNQQKSKPANPQAAPKKSATDTAATAPVEPVKDVRQLVATLSEVDISSGSISQEQAAKWKRSLQQLSQQGASAVPAIRDFLARNVDVDFDTIPGGELLGFSTVRLALFDALRQIGGADSIAASTQVLQTSADPREIAVLTKNLEQQAPGQHRQVAVSAARDALAQAARGQLEGRDVGPLFEILQQFGGATAAGDL